MLPVLLLLASAAVIQTSDIPLQTMSRAEGEETRTLGTGCSWNDRRGQTWRMAMVEDRAAVKRDGRLVILHPAKGNKELFPFTLDRWTDGRTVISIGQMGEPVMTGSESMEMPATLTIRENGRKRSWRGILNCGS